MKLLAYCIKLRWHACQVFGSIAARMQVAQARTQVAEARMQLAEARMKVAEARMRLHWGADPSAGPSWGGPGGLAFFLWAAAALGSGAQV